MVIGDIIFVKGSGFIAWCIKKITQSPYSHTAIYIGDGKVIEARAGKGVYYAEFSQYTDDYDVISLPSSVSQAQLQNGLNWLYKQVGRGYSYWSIVVIAIKRLLGVKLPWYEDDDIICSRLVRDFIYECGLPIPDEDVSPEDDFEYLNEAQ